ncbi:hypothetical protein EQG49_13285 [Periweissella cryptocerci]|uniref:Uncharacterized protein n=1 Tax=Periweissella cryptocerci TaxID=2506420 RepID=A0A4P6YWZ3_9LACO|nr:hypothetical protein [Periweissella cryptocerci]QBO37370.1 hypothetical protein EQG49_13285 [Periweissella cryptocerci]
MGKNITIRLNDNETQILNEIVDYFSQQSKIVLGNSNGTYSPVLKEVLRSFYNVFVANNFSDDYLKRTENIFNMTATDPAIVELKKFVIESHDDLKSQQNQIDLMITESLLLAMRSLILLSPSYETELEKTNSFYVRGTRENEIYEKLKDIRKDGKDVNFNKTKWHN